MKRIRDKKRIKDNAGLVMRRVAAAVALTLAASPATAIFTNGGFESNSFASWTQASGVNNGLLGVPPFTSASLNITPGGAFRGFIRGIGFTDPRAPLLVLPRVGSFTAQVNHETQAGGFMSSIAQQDVIAAADRDVADNLLHVRFSYAAVLLDSGHPDNLRPFFFVRLRNITKSTILFEDFTYEQQPGKVFLSGTGGYRYTQFANVDIVVPNADLGDTLEIEALASDCEPTGHPGYVYIDGFGSSVVGPGGAAPLVPVPTLSEWALITLAMGIGGVAFYSRRRQSTPKLG
jgi:IPTL-CTERM motif